jgi:hypothetical protein
MPFKYYSMLNQRNKNMNRREMVTTELSSPAHFSSTKQESSRLSILQIRKIYRAAPHG